MSKSIAWYASHNLQYARADADAERLRLSVAAESSVPSSLAAVKFGYISEHEIDALSFDGIAFSSHRIRSLLLPICYLGRSALRVQYSSEPLNS